MNRSKAYRCVVFKKHRTICSPFCSPVLVLIPPTEIASLTDSGRPSGRPASSERGRLSRRPYTPQTPYVLHTPSVDECFCRRPFNGMTLKVQTYYTSVHITSKNPCRFGKPVKVRVFTFAKRLDGASISLAGLVTSAQLLPAAPV